MSKGIVSAVIVAEGVNEFESAVPLLTESVCVLLDVCPTQVKVPTNQYQVFIEGEPKVLAVTMYPFEPESMSSNLNRSAELS